MTRLDKPVTRESKVMDRGRPLIVTLHPRHLEVRPKGSRHSYTITYDAAMWLAVKREADETRREKWAEKQQAKKRGGK